MNIMLVIVALLVNLLSGGTESNVPTTIVPDGTAWSNPNYLVQLMYMYKDEKVASCQLRSISLKYLKGYKIDNDIKKSLISAKKEEDYLDVISSLMSLNKHI